MVAERAPAERILILNPGSGAAAGARQRLLEAFGDHRLLELEPGQDPAEAYRASAPAAGAEVVVAGGDGTVGAAVRWLAGSGCTLGIIPTGTYNNFSRALGLPLGIERAVEVVRGGVARPIGLGRAGGLPFLEVAGVGFFGEALLLGEAAKELRGGEALARLRSLTGQRPFRYRLSGDRNESGTATSILVANTPTVGAGIEVGDVHPAEPELELNVQTAGGRAAGLAGLALSLVRRRAAARERSFRIRRVRIETTPPMPVFADVFERGATPADFEARPDDLRVLLP